MLGPRQRSTEADYALVWNLSAVWTGTILVDLFTGREELDHARSRGQYLFRGRGGCGRIWQYDACPGTPLLLRTAGELGKVDWLM